MTSQLPGTERNRERTGKRSPTMVSEWVRHVPEVRNIDLDLIQYCRKCLRPHIIIESKPLQWAYSVPSVMPHWSVTRKLGQLLGIPAMLALEDPAQSRIEARIRSVEGKISRREFTLAEFTDYLSGLRDAHTCP